MMNIKLGIIGSSGGSALFAASDCLVRAGYDFSPVVVVDRKCRLAEGALSRGWKCELINYESCQSFSQNALNVFKREGCRDILLYYSRVLCNPLVDTLRIWNIHPSLLPAFPGLNAIQNVIRAKVALFGATLHKVDLGVDTGPIICQVAGVVPYGADEIRLQRLSYYQKVWLTLLWFELVANRCQKVSSYNFVVNGVELSSFDIDDLVLRSCFVDWVCAIEGGL